MKRIPSHAWIQFSALLVLQFGCALELRAKPDFTASEITASSETVTEGEVAHFRLVLRNRGDIPAEGAELRIQWPLMGYLVKVEGLENLQTNHDERTVTAALPLPVGGERFVDVAVLAPRDAGGSSLALSARLMHFHSMTEMWIHKTIAIDTRIKPDGFRLGGLRTTPAGLVTLAWLFVTGLALAVAGRKAGTRTRDTFFGPRAGVFGIMIAIGFWLIFAAMAWRDYRVLYEWSPSTGTIIGRRVLTQTVSTSQPRSTGSGTASRSSDVSKPEFALRYLVEGREMLSTGYDTGSSLRHGGKAQLEKEFLEWTVGARIPCWYDPHDPADVVVKRGFGGAYLFALLPLFPFWLGWSILRRNFSSAG